MGTYQEHDHSLHLAVRNAFLYGHAQKARTIPIYAFNDDPKCLQTILKNNGVVAFKLAVDWNISQFLNLCSTIGTPLPEHALEVQKFVHDNVVLDVKEVFEQAPDSNMRPFSRDAILAHTENSRAPLATQPNLLAFYCVTAEPQDSPTYLVNMQDVLTKLEPDDKTILEHVRYAVPNSMSPILSARDGTRFFSFRDFGHEPLLWTSDATQFDERRTNLAIERLLEAIYTQPPTAIQWEPGLLVVFNNKAFFHAKPANTLSAQKLARHIRRIRLL